MKWKHHPTAFSGEGSRLFGSRWTSHGLLAVYVSDTQALSALETIVHFMAGSIPSAYAFFPVEFDSSLVQSLSVALPPNWASMPLVTTTIGDAWLQDPKSSCVLSLPSALVPEGTNYLMNPAHADYSKISIGPVMAFDFDQRIKAATTPKNP